MNLTVDNVSVSIASQQIIEDISLHVSQHQFVGFDWTERLREIDFIEKCFENT